MTSRAGFIAGATAALGSTFVPVAGPSAAARPAKILILGGTFFFGPALVDAARARGHEVTLFNRGITNPTLFPELEKLRGDRYPERGRGLAALGASRTWDAVIDTCAPLPRVLDVSLDLLRDRVDAYVFISTIAVYDGFDRTGITEDAGLNLSNNWKPADGEIVADNTYFGRKAWMEATFRTSAIRHPLVIRPGAITGPRDDDDSGRYWPTRVARGGEILAPGNGNDPLQFIDVRDLAAWTIAMIERRQTGTFNAVGPRAEPTTFAEYLGTAVREINPAARITWVDAPFLASKGLTHRELPLFNSRAGRSRGWQSVSTARAVGQGLEFRSLAAVVRDELTWQSAHFPPDYDFGATRGIGAERERQILAEWRARTR